MACTANNAPNKVDKLSKNNWVSEPQSPGVMRKLVAKSLNSATMRWGEKTGISWVGVTPSLLVTAVATGTCSSSLVVMVSIEMKKG